MIVWSRNGVELHRVPGSDTYYARVPVGGGSGGTTHDVHAHVRIGRFDSEVDARAAFDRRFGGGADVRG
jgi:hypothetical protein